MGPTESRRVLEVRLASKVSVFGLLEESVLRRPSRPRILNPWCSLVRLPSPLFPDGVQFLPSTPWSSDLKIGVPNPLGDIRLQSTHPEDPIPKDS